MTDKAIEAAVKVLGEYCSYCGMEKAIKSYEAAKWNCNMDEAPEGYDGKKFNYILFKGFSRSGKISNNPVYVSGYMDGKEPVHWYAYKLNIVAWQPLPQDSEV